MNSRKKIGLWTAGVLGALLLLMLALAAVPLLIDREQIKGRIVNTLSQQLEGDVTLEAVEGSVFPLRGKITGMHLQRPDIYGTAGLVEADFRILPIFRGNLKVDRLVIRNPDFTMALPEPPAEAERAPEGPERWTSERMRGRIAELLSRLEAGMPDATIRIENGTVSLTRGGETLYRFYSLDAEARLPPDKLTVELSTESDVWESMRFNGRIDADGSNAVGELNVGRFRPGRLVRQFAPDLAEDFQPAGMTVDLEFESENFEVILGRLQGSAVYEKIPHPVEITETEFAYTGRSLALGGVGVRAGRSQIEVSSARLELGGENNLHIESAAADIDLDETVPWAVPLLSQVEGAKDFAADYRDIKGRFSFSSLNLQGPLRQPGDWKLSGRGRVEKLVLETGRLPAPLSLERGVFEGTGERVEVELENFTLLGSVLSLSGHVEEPLTGRAAVDASIRGELGSETLEFIAGRFDLPAEITAIRGGVNIDSLQVRGPVLHPEALFVQGSGSVENLVVETGLLPEAVAVDRGHFAIDPENLSLKNVGVDFLDASLAVSGRIQGYREDIPVLDFTFDGEAGEGAGGWMKDRGVIPDWVNVPSRVSISEGRLVWGGAVETALAADLSMEDGLEVTFDLVQGPDRLTVNHLTVDDSTDRASMSMTLGRDILDLDFEGRIAEGTVRKLIEGREDLRGWVQGDFSLHLPTASPAESRVQGRIQAGGFTYTEGLSEPVEVREISIQAEGDRIRIDSADLHWGEIDLEVTGSVGFSPDAVVLDLVAATEGLNWEKISRMVKAETEEEKRAADAPEPEVAVGGLRIEGKVAVQADYFNYGELTWRPFHVTVNIEEDRLGLQLTQGSLCGIPMEGIARVSPEPMRMEAEASVRGEPIAPALDCLFGSRLMSGQFDLAAKITTQGSAENFLDNLQGEFNITAEDGRIFRFELLANVLAVVNITEILRGRAPDLAGEGFGYRTARVSGVIENGVLRLAESYIDGRSVSLAFTGGMNIPERTIDMTVLVTPLTTVDSIIGRIPIIGHIAGDNFMAIPVRVRGDLSDPTVTPMPASAVGMGLLGIVERTLKLPVHVIQPFMSDEE